MHHTSSHHPDSNAADQQHERWTGAARHWGEGAASALETLRQREQERIPVVDKAKDRPGGD